MAKVFHICQEVGGRIVPVNGECDNFSYQTGCLGHDQGDIFEHEQATNAAEFFIDNQKINSETCDNKQHCNATNSTLDEAGNCRLPCPYWDIQNNNCHCYPPDDFDGNSRYILVK